MDGTAARQRVIAANIANADTPAYVRRELAFEANLRDALNLPILAEPERISVVDQVIPEETPDADAPRSVDGNSVNLEQEMATLGKNTLQYEVTSRLLSMEFRQLRNAIHEGRR